MEGAAAGREATVRGGGSCAWLALLAGGDGVCAWAEVACLFCCCLYCCKSLVGFWTDDFVGGGSESSLVRTCWSALASPVAAMTPPCQPLPAPKSFGFDPSGLTSTQEKEYVRDDLYRERGRGEAYA